MPTIYIDDQAFEVPEGDNILQACLSAGLDLPYFCWHPEMGSVGACRQCALVQYRDADDTRGRIVMGCMTPVTEGARFSMQGREASEFRQNIVESLMLNHPHDCPVCAEGGECHLQDITVMVGHRNRRYRGKKNTHKNQDLGPLINHEMNRCITCYRCTRFYNDYAGGTDLAAQASHDHVYFGRQTDGTLESEFAGNLVEVCPTGVFTDKPLVNDYTRKWDLQSAPSVCTGCALGCNTLPGERYGKLKRIHNRFNNEVNGYFLCDRGRFGGAFVNDETRALFAGLRQADGLYNAIESEQALSTLASWCGDGESIVGIGSPRASIESNYLLQRLVGKQNFSDGMSDHESGLVNTISTILQSSSVKIPSMREVEDADAILILGEDVSNTAPRLALALRQSVRNLAKQLATDMRIPLWQDEAVRNLAQDKLSPLYILAVADTRLDDIAQQSVSLSPDHIARVGLAVAAHLNPALAAVEGLSETEQALVESIAASLKQAKRPLVISGTGIQSDAVITAAAAIAKALDNRETMLSYCLPEANTLGVSLLANNESAKLTELCERAANGNIDTLIIAENNLYRRAPKQQIDDLLNNVKQVVVLDSVDSATLSQASLALPAATFAETEGTLVSSEGRAQRHYPVFLPAEQRQASWQWLNKIEQAMGQSGFQQFDEVRSACANDIPTLKLITEASPSAEFRSKGLKIPRQTHRYSGRTAMRADISVHEPKQPVDQDSPLAFTMEGNVGKQSGALLPFVWSPGWNSNQSVHKFQDEVGGALEGGTAGVRLFDTDKIRQTEPTVEVPKASQRESNEWLLVPIYQIFGSDELSSKSPAIAELCREPSIELSSEDAAALGAVNGDNISVSMAHTRANLKLHINDSIASGCAGYAVGLPGSTWLAPQTSAALSKQGGSDV